MEKRIYDNKYERDFGSGSGSGSMGPHPVQMRPSRKFGSGRDLKKTVSAFLLVFLLLL